MSDAVDPVPIETLLAHREWVRRVARALVVDESEADDLEQDLWTGALTRPPRVRGSIRGWLATAVRHAFLNRRRGEVRRARREEAVSRREPQPSTEDVVAAADAHRRVVVEVMQLPEPYRAMVLLRYFQGLSPSAIAEREGVPVETVQTRLRRARETLRDRFAAHGDRGHWRFAIAPLFGPGHAAAPSVPGLVGGILVKTTSKLALALLLLAVVASTGFLLLRGSTSPETTAPPAIATVPPESQSALGPGLAARPPPASTGSDVARRPEETPAGAPPTVAVGPMPRATPEASRRAAPAGEIAGRVLHLADRSPAVGAEVRLMGHGDALPAGAALPSLLVVVTEADGAFRLVGFPPATYFLRASMAGHSEVVFQARVVEGAGVAGIDVLLGPGGAVEGRVTDVRGTPVGGLAVDLDSPADPISGSMKPTRTSTKTDADGNFRFSDVTPAYCTVTVQRGEGREQTGRVRVKEGETARLDFASAAVLSGSLLGDGQAPIAGVRVAARPVFGKDMDYTREIEAVTDAQGRFRLEGLEAGDWRLTVMGGRTLGFNGEVVRTAVAAGENELTLDLGSAAEVSGLVQSRPKGKPLPWPEVQLLLKPTESVDSGGLRWVEGTLPIVAFADAGGRFRFRGLRAGSYRLLADPGTPEYTHWERDLVLVAGERKGGVEVLLERSRPGKVRFTVKDEEGKPVTEASHRLVCPVQFEILTNRLGRGVTATSSEPGVYVAQFEAGPTRVAITSVSLQGPRRAAQIDVDVREGATVDVDVVLQPQPAPR